MNISRGKQQMKTQGNTTHTNKQHTNDTWKHDKRHMHSQEETTTHESTHDFLKQHK